MHFSEETIFYAVLKRVSALIQTTDSFVMGRSLTTDLFDLLMRGIK